MFLDLNSFTMYWLIVFGVPYNIKLHFYIFIVLVNDPSYEIPYCNSNSRHCCTVLTQNVSITTTATKMLDALDESTVYGWNG